MKILLLEPFMEGSHQSWAVALQQHSSHEIKILSLPGRHWKWRMYGGAVSLARQFNALDFQADLLLATDMLDLATFLALTRQKSAGIPTAIYFHENQITYPWSPSDADVKLQRNNQYGFINYTSALAADAIFFNSAYHLRSFTEALPAFLRQFPDHTESDLVDSIRAKSKVLYLGMELKSLDPFQKTAQEKAPLILWNHRWEYDKNPDAFFNSLFRLAAEKIDFRLAILGNAYRKQPPIFAKAKSLLAEQIVCYGYAKNKAAYTEWLWKSDILPVTGIQDFFGGSVVEAIYCGCYPLLPRRLAYPEHLPEALSNLHLYDGEEEYEQKLRALLINGDKINTSARLQNFVSRYDWSTLVEYYDQVFEQSRP